MAQSKKDEDIEKEIEKKINTWEKKMNKKKCTDTNQGGNAVYGVGFVGALIYFMQAADSFWMVILGFLKALVWPAYFVYKFLESVYGVVS